MLIHLDDDWFNKVKNGTKTLEARVNDEKRRRLKIGDTITFENRLDKETINCKVVNLHLFNNFKEMFNSLDNIKLGFSSNNDDNYKLMERFYTEEDQKQYGVVCIELELIK